MALQKQSLPISFAQGLDTKSDPRQVQPGRFLELQNSVFTKNGLLEKRNGFAPLTPIQSGVSTSLATYGNSLLAISDSLQAFSRETSLWIEKGAIQPIDLEAVPVIRTSLNDTSADVAVASNGLAVVVSYNGTTCQYCIIDAETGENVTPITLLPSPSKNPRAFVLGRYFIVTFIASVGGNPQLQYVAIPTNQPLNPRAADDISTTIDSLDAGYDATVANNVLYLGWYGSDIGGAVRLNRLDSSLNLYSPEVLAGFDADLFSVAANVSGPTPIIYFTWWDAGSEDMYCTVTTQTLAEITAPTQILANTELAGLTSVFSKGTLNVFYEVFNEYSYDSIRTDYINSMTVAQDATPGTPALVARSVGLASKAFYLESKDKNYVLATYGGTYQPTYFLLDEDGNVLAKLAYSNGGGWQPDQILSSVHVDGDVIKFAYLYKDLLASANKAQGVSTIGGVYSQTGVNLATLAFNASPMVPSEVGGTLQLSGGITWQYDGSMPVECGFNLWPEDLDVATATTGGFIAAQDYSYVATYEWTDAAGNLQRSAPSIPVNVTTTGATSENTVSIPTLRLTYKGGVNPVRIVLYRWSTAQPIFYQVSSISAPTLNNPTVDSVAFVDTLADSSIIGNVILYTTGGVVENIGAPASAAMALYKNRQMLINAEDRNVIYYSKPVVQNTPVEFSDLFTIYVAPTTSAQGYTGPTTAISAMDDKFIIFKRNSIYYMTGNGPDIAGANNDFSDPTFITSTVGCTNQQSIVFTPNGLMFQSDKGIWLLNRSLQTQYIGAPVEAYNNASVVSAINVPGTNQVRFTLDSGVTLMYDYYYDQWGTFTNIPGISSVLYEGYHTFLNAQGRVFQESPGRYLDGSIPVVMKFTTAWLNMAGLQGFERAYQLFLLGTYITPHKLYVSIGFDYASSPSQTSVITPDIVPQFYGSDPLYGASAAYGGNDTVEQYRVFLRQQKTQAIQVTVQEVFDLSYGGQAGAGFTLSGMNLIYGIKGNAPKLRASRSVG